MCRGTFGYYPVKIELNLNQVFKGAQTSFMYCNSKMQNSWQISIDLAPFCIFHINICMKYKYLYVTIL